MDNFRYYNPVAVHFGRGEENNVGELIRAYGGERVLLVYGGGSIKANGLYDRITSALRSSQLTVFELGGVKPNPRLDLVECGAKLCREKCIDFILAVGGGSTIDTAKSVACAVKAPLPIWEYFKDGNKQLTEALPIGVVLTMPAAGSETSDSAVLTDQIGGHKLHIAGDCMMPKFAVMNPEITYSMTPFQIACGAMDICAHLLERYFTPTENVLFTDNLIEAALKTILEIAPRALKTPQDYNVRAELMWTGTVAHNNLLNTGRVGDWASHWIEHELSGIYDIAHGEGLAVIFPAWMKYVRNVCPDRFVRLAVNVFGVDASLERDIAIDEMIARFERWILSLGLKTRISKLGIDNSRFHEMAQKCVQYIAYVGQFMHLAANDIERIYNIAYC